MARQLTFAALAAAIVAGVWQLNAGATTDVGRYVVPLVLLTGGLWICFRIVNLPRFADFLISVEAEMNKVSWPGRSELYRASLVVIVVIFLLAAILFGYDILLKLIMSKIFGL